MIRKTPGVYIEKIDTSRGIIPEVETALPAFIGYTEKAVDADGNSLAKIPNRIRDLNEFESRFGGGFEAEEYKVFINGSNSNILDVEIPTRFYLYDSIQGFYENGGKDCIIISIGGFDELIKEKDFEEGLAVLEREEGPTLILMPDAVGLFATKPEDADIALGQIQQKCLQQCNKLKDRFSIFDIREGHLARLAGSDPIANFRDQVGNNYLNYGAVYYPWIYTSRTFPIRSRYLTVWAEDDQGSITPRSFVSLSNSSSLQKLIKQTEKSRAEVDALIALCKPIEAYFEDGFTLNVKNISPYSTLIGEKLTNIRLLKPSALEADIRKTWDDFIGTVHTLILALGQIPSMKTAAIQRAYSRLKPSISRKIAPVIMELIGLEKHDSFLGLGSVPQTLDLINEKYQNLDQSIWVGGLSIVDLPVANTGATGSTLQEHIVKASSLLNPLAIRIAQNFTELFDAVFEEELEADRVLFAEDPFFKEAGEKILLSLRTLPPSGYVTGLYSATDEDRGVFKAAANVAIESVLGTTVDIDDQAQESLNVHTTGKSVNAIRSFVGQGTTIWGARTLAGNDLEWRYVPVRRLFIFIETSLKKAMESQVFEPNDEFLWNRIRFETRAFLREIWIQGGLSGANEDEAFFISIGLGETMLPEDILEGRMIMEVGLAASRPLEFITLRLVCRIERN